MYNKNRSTILLRLTATDHVLAFVLASAANILLLYNQASLASRIGSAVDLAGSIGFQELAIAILVVAVAITSLSKGAWKIAYVIASFLFSGYAGLKMAGTFFSTLSLVPTLQANGIGFEDYLPTSYATALASAVSYTLSILLLRRAYGKLASARVEQGTVG